MGVILSTSIALLNLKSLVMSVYVDDLILDSYSELALIHRKENEKNICIFSASFRIESIQIDHMKN